MSYHKNGLRHVEATSSGAAPTSCPAAKCGFTDASSFMLESQYHPECSCYNINASDASSCCVRQAEDWPHVGTRSQTVCNSVMAAWIQSFSMRCMTKCPHGNACSWLRQPRFAAPRRQHRPHKSAPSAPRSAADPTMTALKEVGLVPAPTIAAQPLWLTV